MIIEFNVDTKRILSRVIINIAKKLSHS